MPKNHKSKNTLKVCEDLELEKVSVPNLPKDILFPDELNKYLRDQVQYLTHENGMLYKNFSEVEMQLKESRTKLTNLTTQLEEYHTVCPQNSLASSSSNVASTKIVELSKKLRERNSELELYKTKCSKLQKHIFEAEKEKDKTEEPIPAKPKNELEDQIKTLQEKLGTTNMKLCEVRNTNAQLKNDLKIANKLLQQEIGDALENLQISSNPNWRGRAQIICDLQQKNNELREKLKAYQDKEKGNAPIVQPNRTDKRIEILSQENSDLKNALQDVKKKLEALKARNRVLESEGTNLRAKISSSIEQNDRDHDMIASLTAKVSQAQEIQNDTWRQKVMEIQKVEQENKNLQLQIAKQTCKIENLTAQFEDQKREIESLRNKTKLPSNSLYNRSAPEDTELIKKLQVEHLRLLDLIKSSNGRLEEERREFSQLQKQHLVERQRAAKLETKVAHLELDQRSDRSSAYSNLSIKTKDSYSDLQNRLELAEETIKALQTKLAVLQKEKTNDFEEFRNILLQNNTRISK